LGNKGYESYLPLYTGRRRWSDRIKELELPLFAGYLFCRLDLEQRRLPVLTTPGVRQIIGVGKVPAPVPESEIDAVRAVIASGLAAQPWPYLAVGNRVRVRHGSLNGVEGILLATKKHHRLVVSVELLRRAVAVDIDEAWVEPVPPAAVRVPTK
jgi:transcription antitermination factor NusG